MWVSQAISWPMSFVAPLLAFVFLSLPLPRPTAKITLGFILVLAASSYAGVVLLPFLQHARWVGIGLFVLALFHTFYFTARGGSAVIGMLMTVGLTLVAAVGSVSSVVMVEIAKWLTICAVWAMGFVWLAHALIPDPPSPPGLAGKKPPPAARPDLETAHLRAMRSMLIVLPIALIFFFSSASTSYLIVMIKVATMGQQANGQQPIGGPLDARIYSHRRFRCHRRLADPQHLALAVHLHTRPAGVCSPGRTKNLSGPGAGPERTDVVVRVPDHDRGPGPGGHRRLRQ
jgi:hypothetical protein